MKDHGSTVHREGDGTPLLLLHGMGGSWRVWKPLLAGLTPHHDVIAITLPGHRGVAAPAGEGPVTVSDIGELVERQLDQLGIDTPHVVGNSYGGAVALELARRGRARSVVALAPAGAWRRPLDLRRLGWQVKASQALCKRERMSELLADPRRRRALLRAAVAHGDRIPDAEVPDMLLDIVECTLLSRALAGYRSDGQMRPLDAGETPIVLGWPGLDRTLPWRRYGEPLAKQVPAADVRLLPDTGHVPMYDDPDLVNGLVLQTTRRAEAALARPQTINPEESTRSPSVSTASMSDFAGTHGTVVVHSWPVEEPTFVAVIAHGFGEHAGRYAHVAAKLNSLGATVVAPDHVGHGRSEGPRARVALVEDMVTDLASLIEATSAANPGLDVVLIGHSLGGVVTTRYAQRYDGAYLAALALSGPAIGGNPAFSALLEMDPLPDIPIDPAALSRDPAVGEAYLADELVYHGALTRESLEALDGMVARVVDGGSLGDLPTLWLHGENDPLAPMEATRGVIDKIAGPGLAQISYPGAMHEIFNETNSDEVLADLADFLVANTASPNIA